MQTRAATALSLVFQPLLTGLYLLLLAAVLDTGSLASGLGWAAGVILLAVAVPGLDIARRVRSGRAGDFQLAVREERLRPLLVALACAIVAFAVVASLDGPRALLVTMAVGLACGLVLTLVTLRWKISFHAAALSAALVLAVWHAGGWGLLLAPLLLAVAWSRVYLRRHSPAQVAAGALAAAAVSAGVLALGAG